MFSPFRLCRALVLPVHHGAFSSRFFSVSTPALAGRKKYNKPPVISKKKLQAKERRRELKRAEKKRSAYEDEKIPLVNAIRVLRAVEVMRPNATYELVVCTLLGRGSAIPRGRVSLPHAPKPAKVDRIIVFAEGRAADDAKRAGADLVGGVDLVDGVATGRHQANIYLATPGMVKVIAPRLGRVLGPRGLMPTDRRGTVTEDPAGYIRRLKGSDEWKSDKGGTIRTPIGKLSFPVQNVVQNVRHFVDAVKKETSGAGDKKSGGKKQTPIRRVVLSSQQGPGITISDVL